MYKVKQQNDKVWDSVRYLTLCNMFRSPERDVRDNKRIFVHAFFGPR